MKNKITFLLFALLVTSSLFANKLSSISVDVKMDESSYVTGERIRAVVDVRNVSANKISVGYANSKDSLVIEVFKYSDSSQLERKTKRAFVAAFSVNSNEGQMLETFLGDHYNLRAIGRYQARAVLIHKGYRYQGPLRSFSIETGKKLSSARQMFAKIPNKSRYFDLLSERRNGITHLFVSARDEWDDGKEEFLGTTDVGAMLLTFTPSISILPSGEVIVLHRNGVDSFVRSEFWSLPTVLHLKSRMSVADPATAGQRRIQELYKEEGGIKPVSRPWWKFW